MQNEKSDPWGSTTLKKSSDALTVLVINSLFVACFLFASVMHSFLQMPMFGNEIYTSPSYIIISALILTLTLDVIALWRAVKLAKQLDMSGWSKAFLWAYQIVFLAVVGYANFWMMTLVWYWWGK